ncbi:hypothetical protein AB7C87_08210 [Natrarchaeobius sp. A-rgal3]|uniref:DUF7551 domain-containing protein n=1 Tax=Natrarchaeobius versutus TaxID=1679078 RepID=UPI00350F01BE
MVGTTLREIRSRIEQLTVDDGRYAVVCARSGEQPVPVVGERFATRGDAAKAAQATERYRDALRRYDPQLSFYDPIVTERQTGEATEAKTPRERRDSRSTNSETGVRDRRNESLMEFCHDVSGAVFESLSARDHGDVERTIMDTYLAAAETVADRDLLCLVLLETMATELERQLSVTERDELVREAARHLAPAPPSSDPIVESLEYLSSLSLVAGFGSTRYPIPETGEDAWIVYVHGYAVDSSGRTFPTLPFGVDLLRRVDEPSSTFGVTEANALGDGNWRLVLTAQSTATGGLVCAREHR